MELFFFMHDYPRPGENGSISRATFMKSSAWQLTQKETGWSWCTGIPKNQNSSGRGHYACS